MVALSAAAVFAQPFVTISGPIDVGVSNPIGTGKTRMDQSGIGTKRLVSASTGTSASPKTGYDFGVRHNFGSSAHRTGRREAVYSSDATILAV